jgi:hypothetical protein
MLSYLVKLVSVPRIAPVPRMSHCMLRYGTYTKQRARPALLQFFHIAARFEKIVQATFALRSRDFMLVDMLLGTVCVSILPAISARDSLIMAKTSRSAICPFWTRSCSRGAQSLAQLSVVRRVPCAKSTGTRVV